MYQNGVTLEIAKNICLICGDTVAKSIGSHLKKHKISIKDYCVKYVYTKEFLLCPV